MENLLGLKHTGQHNIQLRLLQQDAGRPLNPLVSGQTLVCKCLIKLNQGIDARRNLLRGLGPCPALMK